VTLKDFVYLRKADAKWMRDAACRDADGQDFFPKSMTTAAAARAVAMCNSCSVQDECARYAMVNDIEYGIWGGLSPRARREIVTSRTRPIRQQEKTTYETYTRFKAENRNDPVKATARELNISAATVYHHIRIVKFRILFENLVADSPKQRRNGDVVENRVTHHKRQASTRRHLPGLRQTAENI